LFDDFVRVHVALNYRKWRFPARAGSGKMPGSLGSKTVDVRTFAAMGVASLGH
jgi:hypothetical protein